MSDNLARILTAAAEQSPDEIAIKLDDTEVSYGMLDEGSARLAGLLKEKDVQAGDRVGVMLPNVPYFPIAYYGVLRAGGAVGRRLDFLMQELNREANTLGSKAAAIEMTNASVELKIVIEQMREQIQNLE